MGFNPGIMNCETVFTTALVTAPTANHLCIYINRTNGQTCKHFSLPNIIYLRIWLERLFVRPCDESTHRSVAFFFIESLTNNPPILPFVLSAGKLIHPHVCLSFHQIIHALIHPYVCLFFHLIIHTLIHSLVRPCIHLFIRLSDLRCTHLPIHQSV